MRQESEQLKVAPILPQDSPFCSRLFTVLTTISPQHRVLQLIMHAGVILSLYLPACLQLGFQLLPVGVSCFALTLLTMVLQKIKDTPFKIILYKAFLCVICHILWSRHLLLAYSYGNIVFIPSLITLSTSLPTLFSHFQEFSSNAVQFQTVALDSTMLVRVYLCLPPLVVTLILSYINTDHTISMWVTAYIFALWVLGWITHLKAIVYVVLNKFNCIVLGDEEKINIYQMLLTITLNCASVAGLVALSFHVEAKYLIVWILVLTSFTSIASYLQTVYSTRMKCTVIPFLSEIISLTILIPVSFYLPTTIVFVYVDLFLFTLWITLKRITICISINPYTFVVLRLLLRIFSALSILQLLNFERINLPIFQGILLYRVLKRTLSCTNTYSLHLSLLLSLIGYHIGAGSMQQMVLWLMPPYPLNPILAVSSCCNLPAKAIHKWECMYRVGYILCSAVGVVLYLGTLGVLQLSMVLGLPIWMPVIPNWRQGEQPTRHPLYEKITYAVPEAVFRGMGVGMYLLRIDKYILLVEVVGECYGWGVVYKVKGLEVQETTSCHARAAEAIDLVATEAHQCKGMCNLTVLTPIQTVSIEVPVENGIQLTGILEQREFIKLWKDTAMKALIYNIGGMQFEWGEVEHMTMRECGRVPVQFAEEVGFKITYPRKKLPPIKVMQKKNGNNVNDFMDLLDSSVGNNQFKGEESANQLQIKGENSQQLEQGRVSELKMLIIANIYHFAVHKFDYFNAEKLVKIVNMDLDSLMQIDSVSVLKFAAKSLAMAFKIAVDQHLTEGGEATKQDFEEYLQNSFVGCVTSEEYKNAVQRNMPSIWRLSYQHKQLSVNRLARVQMKMYVLAVDNTVVKGVWNNLTFQLIFAANNDDERYSIQTHPYLLRNLWVEACNEPFGYPLYHSELFFIQ